MIIVIGDRDDKDDDAYGNGNNDSHGIKYGDIIITLFLE